jgi:beta-ribofuranosylaminobenzene 5'-phosphate synthase
MLEFKGKPINISIKTTSRLHLGFLDLNGDLGRRFGSIGVSLNDPFTQLTIKKHDCLCVENGDEVITQKILTYVDAFSKYFGLSPRVLIRIVQKIPEHKGLGSGSQMALAVSTALARLYGIDPKVSELALATGRGKRSSIGIQSFTHGGLILDAGKEIDSKGNLFPAPPATLVRMDFPKEWQFVILVPEKPLGLSGKKENRLIQSLNPPGKNSEKICRLVMMKLLPAFIARDIKTFGNALSELDYRTGLFFEPVQGGIYSEKSSSSLINHLLGAGAYGAGQSSWGPAIYGLVLGSEAGAIARSMEDFLRERQIEARVMIASAANRGASIEWEY